MRAYRRLCWVPEGVPEAPEVLAARGAQASGPPAALVWPGPSGQARIAGQPWLT